MQNRVFIDIQRTACALFTATVISDNDFGPLDGLPYREQSDDWHQLCFVCVHAIFVVVFFKCLLCVAQSAVCFAEEYISDNYIWSLGT